MWNKIKSKPLLKNFVLALGTAIFLIVATLLWLRFYTHHGEKIETPNFMGLSIEEATELAETNNLRLGVDSVFSSKQLNTVSTQNPVPHSDSTESWVKRERIIYLTVVRKTRQKIKLPHIKDKHKSLASSRLAISGLTPKWEYVASPYKNAVLEVKYKGKKIKTGHLLPKGSVVTVILGKGKGTAAQISLPNLVGKTISEANLELANKSFSLVPVYPPDLSAEDSATVVVVQQSPEFTEGATAAEGSDIVIILEK